MLIRSLDGGSNFHSSFSSSYFLCLSNDIGWDNNMDLGVHIFVLFPLIKSNILVVHQRYLLVHLLNDISQMLIFILIFLG